jgi:hypothetical protein
MDEARAVLARLERIDRLAAADGLTELLLAELDELAWEAVAWAKAERDPAAAAAAAACLEALGAREAVPHRRALDDVPRLRHARDERHRLGPALEEGLLPRRGHDRAARVARHSNVEPA